MRGGVEYTDWDLTNYLLADLIDLLQWSNYITMSVHSGKNAKKLKRPKAYPRPGVKTPGADNPFASAFKEDAPKAGSSNSIQLPKAVMDRSGKGPAKAEAPQAPPFIVN
ncbi:hypothetical protein [Streptomyces sp. NPDC127112]|uniref:hypothetical protein n=1 Tax=Streptomyces sp. NPDC127112 TaxID=3345364 RepID=UPI0036288E27